MFSRRQLLIIVFISLLGAALYRYFGDHVRQLLAIPDRQAVERFIVENRSLLHCGVVSSFQDMCRSIGYPAHFDQGVSRDLKGQRKFAGRQFQAIGQNTYVALGCSAQRRAFLKVVSVDSDRLSFRSLTGRKQSISLIAVENLPCNKQDSATDKVTESI